VDNTWNAQNHPRAFPFEAHFSWFGGATHNGDVSFWNEGDLASPGMVQMAETGFTTTLMQEVQAALDAGEAHSKLDYPWWFCPAGTDSSKCGEKTVEFDIDPDFPEVTLVSMLGPSPDWFIGVSGLSLRENGQWLDQVVVDLVPYDAGTRSANQFALFGPQNNPPEPISRITAGSRQRIGPQSLGTMTFTLIPEPSGLALLMGIGMLALRRRVIAR